MSGKPEIPFLTVIGGTAVRSKPARKSKIKKAKQSEPDAKISAAGKIIEALLPAYAELHRAWAKGSREAHTFCDANFSIQELGTAGSPGSQALNGIYENSGANAAQAGMSALFRKLSPLAQTIARSKTTSPQGLRAKTLAAMWQCVPGSDSDSGFDFEDGPPAYEMLFWTCIQATGLSTLAREIEGRLRIEGRTT